MGEQKGDEDQCPPPALILHEVDGIIEVDEGFCAHRHQGSEAKGHLFRLGAPSGELRALGPADDPSPQSAGMDQGRPQSNPSNTFSRCLKTIAAAFYLNPPKEGKCFFQFDLFETFR